MHLAHHLYFFQVMTFWHFEQRNGFNGFGAVAKAISIFRQESQITQYFW
jgi:hypothetical protein